MTTQNPSLDVREAVGPHLAQIAQALRLIQQDAETCIAAPASAFELAALLEETRERSAIAYALINQALDRIDEAHDTGTFTASPLTRAQLAMRPVAGGET